MFARRAALVPVPIGDRHCFTQRFSPTGFILNASEPTNLTQSFCPRIQVKTYPFSSIHELFTVELERGAKLART